MSSPFSVGGSILERVAGGTRSRIRAGLNAVGLDIVRFSRHDPYGQRRALLFEDADVVLDVGANCGQYGWLVRNQGFGGRIVSFEPLAEAFAELSLLASSDPHWECHRLAIADKDSKGSIHVSKNLASSSFLPLNADFVKRFPNLRYVKEETVDAARLDGLRSRVLCDDERVFLKLDVQGFELQVLRGAEETLPQVSAVECEFTIAPIYDGQTIFADAIRFLAKRGFHLCAIQPAYSDAETGEWLQFDGLLTRNTTALRVSC